MVTRIRVAAVGVLVVGSLAAFAGGAHAAPAVPGEIIVGFKSSAGGADRLAVRREHHAKFKRTLPIKGVQVVKVPSGTSVKAAARALRRERGVRYAEPNARYDYALIPNDPKFAEQWGLHNTGQSGGFSEGNGTPDADIDAPEAWDTTTGSSAVKIGHIDSGIDYNHPDLAPNIWHNPGESGSGKETNGVDDDGNGKIDDWRGWDFISNDNDPRDTNNHGTATAGTLGAVGNDGTGIAGVSWQSKIIPARAQDAASLIAAIAYTSASGAKVVNMSLVCRGLPSTCAASSLEAAIAAAPNTLFVTAAGNDSLNNDSYPAYPCTVPLDNVICVAASTRKDNLASFSAYGSQTVDLAAPGQSVTVASPIYEKVFNEGFESDIGSTWTTGGSPDSWARSTEAHQGPGSYGLDDSPGTDYTIGADNFARTTDPIDLANEAGCSLQLNYLADLRAGGILRVEVSTDGSAWTQLGAIGAQNNTNGTTFKQFEASLAAYDGQQAYVRMHFTSNPSFTSQGDGVHVDNVSISCLDDNYAGSQFAYALGDGTSIAAPYVSGAAALVWANSPSASVANVRTALLNTVDVKSAGSKTASGGRLNVWRALHYSPPAPPTFTGTAPASGSNNNLPRIKGNAPAGTTVRLYTSAGCTGGGIGSATAADFAGSGILVGVNDNTTTTFRAKSFSETGGSSTCSPTSISYEEKTPKSKKDPIIGSASYGLTMRSPLFIFNPIPFIAGGGRWGVSDNGKLAGVSENQTIIQNLLPVQPGTCSVLALGSKSLRVLAAWDNGAEPQNDCTNTYAGSRFDDATVDDKGTQVAFSADLPFRPGLDAQPGTPQIYLARGNVISEVTTGSAEGISSTSPSLSGNGRVIVFSSNGDFDDDNSDANAELFAYDTIGQGFTQLTDTQDCYNGNVGGTGIDTNVDGNRSVFLSNCDFNGQNPAFESRAFVLDRASGTISMLSGCDTCSSQGFKLVDGFSISSDGNTVASYQSHWVSGPQERLFIHDLDPANGDEVNFEMVGPIAFDFTQGAFNRRSVAPAISADGKRIAFTAKYNPVARNDDGSAEIFLIDRKPTGDQTRQLTDTHYSNGQSADSIGQTMNAKGKVLYLSSGAGNFNKPSAGVYRLALKPAK